MIYSWDSTALTVGGHGLIVVSGDNADQAREEARKEWIKYSRQAYSYIYGNPEKKENAEDLDRLFEEEIAKEPGQVRSLMIVKQRGNENPS